MNGDLVKEAADIAVAAGKLLKRVDGQEAGVRYKSPVDPVTDADIEAEKMIVEAINSRFPDHGIEAEEGTALREDASHLWLIDPLDGTVNFSHGFPVYAVSIALEVEGELMVGVVYNPNADELFTAEKGKGAFLNGEAIRVSDIQVLSKALLATGFPYYTRMKPGKIFTYFQELTMRAQGVRRPGSAAIDLCDLACSRFDGFWELGLQPWDTAAGSLIASEAGARLSKFDGARFDIRVPEILAANPHIHREMLAVFAQLGH